MIARILACMLFIFGALSCSTTPTGRSQLAFMPESQMAKMGDQSFAQMKDNLQVSRDRGLNDKINCIASRIVNRMDGEGAFQNWDVKVFKDPAINAFALPGKNIGVYTGLIDAAENNAQIASVIGHEVGHVIADHGNERVSQNLIVQGGLLAADIALNTGNKTKDRLILASLGLASQVGVLLPFSRKHESEADQIGLRLMAQAGFDPREAIAFWKNMADKNREAGPPELLSTHPAHSSRIENLREHMSDALKTYRDNKALPDCP